MSYPDLRFELDRGVATLTLDRPEALVLAREIADHAAPLSVAVTKRPLWQSSALVVAAVERAESALHRHLMAGPDAREGGLAWLERRPPRWQGSVSADWPDWPIGDG